MNLAHSLSIKDAAAECEDSGPEIRRYEKTGVAGIPGQ
jgi:hypothetical protein